MRLLPRNPDSSRNIPAHHGIFLYGAPPTGQLAKLIVGIWRIAYQWSGVAVLGSSWAKRGIAGHFSIGADRRTWIPKSAPSCRGHVPMPTVSVPSIPGKA